jgi:hypothetical protein
MPDADDGTPRPWPAIDKDSLDDLRAHVPP